MAQITRLALADPLKSDLTTGLRGYVWRPANASDHPDALNAALKLWVNSMRDAAAMGADDFRAVDERVVFATALEAAFRRWGDVDRIFQNSSVMAFYKEVDVEKSPSKPARFEDLWDKTHRLHATHAFQIQISAAGLSIPVACPVRFANGSGKPIEWQLWLLDTSPDPATPSSLQYEQRGIPARSVPKSSPATSAGSLTLAPFANENRSAPYAPPPTPALATEQDEKVEPIAGTSLQLPGVKPSSAGSEVGPSSPKAIAPTPYQPPSLAELEPLLKQLQEPNRHLSFLVVGLNHSIFRAGPVLVLLNHTVWNRRFKRLLVLALAMSATRLLVPGAPI